MSARSASTSALAVAGDAARRDARRIASAQRVGAHRLGDDAPVVAGVEHQVDRGQDRGHALARLLGRRHLEEVPVVGEDLLRADEALLHGRAVGEEGARHLAGAEAAHEAQDERRPAVVGQRRVAAREHHPQEVGALVGRLLGLDLGLVGRRAGVEDARPDTLASERVAGAVAHDGEEPPLGIARQLVAPRLERGDERLLDDVLGLVDPPDAEHAHERRRHPPRLAAEERRQHLPGVGPGHVSPRARRVVAPRPSRQTRRSGSPSRSRWPPRASPRGR